MGEHQDKRDIRIFNFAKGLILDYLKGNRSIKVINVMIISINATNLC